MAAVQAELREQQPEVLEAAAAAAAPAPAGEAVPACVASGARDEWEVTFLGTGAAVPSKYRNVTGIHVNLFARGGMLMDCGACGGAGAVVGAAEGCCAGFAPPGLPSMPPSLPASAHTAALPARRAACLQARAATGS